MCVVCVGVCIVDADWQQVVGVCGGGLGGVGVGQGGGGGLGP